MTSPHDPSSHSESSEASHSATPSTEADFDLTAFATDLETVEASLQTLKLRYAQVQEDQSHRDYLEQQRHQTQQQLRQARSPEEKRQLQQELRQLRQRLEELDFALESHLFTWSSLKEPFWQAVRFGGLGIVIGWILKSCAG